MDIKTALLYELSRTFFWVEFARRRDYDSESICNMVICSLGKVIDLTKETDVDNMSLHWPGDQRTHPEALQMLERF